MEVMEDAGVLGRLEVKGSAAHRSEVHGMDG